MLGKILIAAVEDWAEAVLVICGELAQNDSADDFEGGVDRNPFEPDDDDVHVVQALAHLIL